MLIYCEIDKTKLKFGVNRPKSWWDSQPVFYKRMLAMKESIEKEGMNYPLSCNDNYDGTFTVNCGCTRLEAVNRIDSIDKIKCIVQSDEPIPGGKAVSKAEIVEIFDGKVRNIIDKPLQIQPIVDPRWNTDSF